MQVHTNELSKFNPVKLEIIFESENEIAEFYSIFNWMPITNSLTFIDSDKIRSCLGAVVYLKASAGFQRKLSDGIKEFMSI